MKRIGMLTSGGDCQGLNAALRGVGKALFQYVDNIEIFGMYDGYRGLIENDYKFMAPGDFSGIIAHGGTILGTSRQPYVPGKAIVDKDGKVTDARVVKGVSDALDAEALKVVSASPKWKPGRVNGNKVRTVVSIPIEFKLEKKGAKGSGNRK